MQKIALDLWKKDPAWATIIALGVVLGIAYLIGPGGQQTILTNLHNVGTDPVATGQAIGAAGALVLAVIAGLLWFVPFFHGMAGTILKGLGFGLVILFVLVPLLGWFVQHHADLGTYFANIHAASSPTPKAG